MPRPVALVSASEARHHDSDLPLLVRAFADRGVPADIVDWDSDQDWSRWDLVIVRSPWDYHKRLEEFLAWVDSVSAATTLVNPRQMLRWNTDKGYLAELIEAEIPCVPTAFVAVDEDLAGVDLDGDIVVKPTVSAGSNNTERHTGDPDDAEHHIRNLLAMGKTAMVQPYQRFIDDNGETGLLFFDGVLSHAFRKGPILSSGDNVKNGLFVEEDIGPREPNDQEIELGEAVLGFVTDKFDAVPLYARVDMVRGSRGAPVVMELEMTEPSLFLHVAPGSAERFVSAALARR